VEAHQDCKSLVQARRFLRASDLQFDRVAPEGRKSPDFFCTSPREIWVEVKSIGRRPVFDALHKAKLDLERSINIIKEYRVLARVSENITPELVRKLSILTKLGHLHRIQSDSLIWCSIDSYSRHGRAHLTRIALRDETTAVFAYFSDDSKPYIPDVVIDRIVQPQTLNVSVDDNNLSFTGFLQERSVQVFLEMSPVTDKLPQGGVRAISPMAASRSPDRRQLRNRLKEASKQLNARSQRNQAALLLFYVVDFKPAELTFLSAFLGNLTAKFNVPADFERKIGEYDDEIIYFGEDRQFTRCKNTSISAVAMIDRTGRALLLHNPFAINPLTDVNWNAKVLLPDVASGQIKVLRD
jgi:hypothetical protein